jgi:hypothetical protein
MTRPSDHRHAFDDREWPFSDPANTLAITTRQVMTREYSVFMVCHDNDGTWQILCGTTNDSADGMAVCLGCAFEHDRSIGAVADLPLGWMATRESDDAPWIREKMQPLADES